MARKPAEPRQPLIECPRCFWPHGPRIHGDGREDPLCGYCAGLGVSLAEQRSRIALWKMVSEGENAAELERRKKEHNENYKNGADARWHVCETCREPHICFYEKHDDGRIGVAAHYEEGYCQGCVGVKNQLLQFTQRKKRGQARRAGETRQGALLDRGRAEAAPPRDPVTSPSVKGRNEGEGPLFMA